LAVAREQRLVVEPACGAAVAAVLQRALPVLQQARHVLVILCGGACTTYEDLLALKQDQSAPRTSQAA
jgi:L-serine/L-threonine ammonia-lyase